MTIFQIVSGVGDILVEHFEGSNGETMRRLFGDLCCKEKEILVFYKEMLKSDKKFHSYMKVNWVKSRVTTSHSFEGDFLPFSEKIIFR